MASPFAITKDEVGVSLFVVTETWFDNYRALMSRVEKDALAGQPEKVALVSALSFVKDTSSLAKDHLPVSYQSWCRTQNERSLREYAKWIWPHDSESEGHLRMQSQSAPTFIPWRPSSSRLHARNSLFGDKEDGPGRCAGKIPKWIQLFGQVSQIGMEDCPEQCFNID